MTGMCDQADWHIRYIYEYDIYVNTVWFISGSADKTHIIQVHVTSMTHRYGDMTDKYDICKTNVRT